MGERGHSWQENVSSKTKVTSRQDQATNRAQGQKDCSILVGMGHWMTVGTTHSTISIVNREASLLELRNVQFSQGPRSGDTVYCAVLGASLGGWLLELCSVQLELVQGSLYAIPEAKAEALSSENV